MKLIYTTIITLFLLISALNVKSQNKYEYGQVTYAELGNPKGYSISTSISGEYKIVAEGKVTDGNVFSNFTPVNKVLNDLAEQGWEVYNTTTNGTMGVSYYYIRKKKP